MAILKAQQYLKALRGSVSNVWGRFYAKSQESEQNGSDEEKQFNKRYTEIFKRQDIDGWEIRQVMNNLAGMDLVPDPTIIDASLQACRRVDDIALAIRWLECCRYKCGEKEKVIFPYLMEQVGPTMKELGIPTLEELGYDEPQLALKSVFDM